MIRNDLRSVWGISQRAAAVLFFLPFLGFGCLGIAHFVTDEIWDWIDEEDGPLEWLQFVGLMISCVFSLAIGYLFAVQRRVVAAGLYFLLGFGLFFIAGEEIAWGQRLFQFETPESLAEINEKQELSVHNVASITEVFNIGKLVVGLYGVFGCWVLAWMATWRDVRSLDVFVVPWFLSSAFLLIVVQRLLRWTILRTSVPRGYGEVDEAFFVFGVTAFVILIWRRLRIARVAKPETAAAGA